MGNYVSCTLATAGGRQSKAVKVVFPDGTIRHLDGPTNAAELMLDVPNHFVANSRSLSIGRRFLPLAADEELEMGNVYVLVPMRRVNSAVTAADMGLLLFTANSAVKRAAAGKARVQPEVAAVVAPEITRRQPEITRRQTDAPRLSLHDLDDQTVMQMTARLSMCRSRKPMLETIVEEGVRSR